MKIMLLKKEFIKNVITQNTFYDRDRERERAGSQIGHIIFAKKNLGRLKKKKDWRNIYPKY